MDNWADHFDKCGGSKQSPIDLDPATAKPANFHPLYMGNYDTNERTMQLTNNGHTGEFFFLSLIHYFFSCYFYSNDSLPSSSES